MRSSMIPPSSWHSIEYCAWPTSSAPGSLTSAYRRNATASPPWTPTSPMCERPKRPTAFRTVRCSSMIEVYWTGISNPANGTRRAPALTWASWSGVRSSAACVTCPSVRFRCGSRRGLGAAGVWVAGIGLGIGRRRHRCLLTRGQHLRGPLHHCPLRRVREERERLDHRKPAYLVELGVVVLDAATHGTHEIEVDRLVEAGRATDEEVADGANRLLELHLEPRLLARLAQRRLLQGLARVGCALWERPERRAAAMDERDFSAAIREAVGDAAS